MKLWPKALPRPTRFHDLRHTTATLLLRAGVDPSRVQRVLRHRDVKTTTGTYGHLDVEDLRSAVEKLPDLGELPRAVRAPAGARFSTRFLPEPENGARTAAGPLGNAKENQEMRRRAIQDSNLWPLAPEANALSS